MAGTVTAAVAVDAAGALGGTSTCRLTSHQRLLPDNGAVSESRTVQHCASKPSALNKLPVTLNAYELSKGNHSESSMQKIDNI